MTWSLAHESDTLTTDRTETSPMVVFWDYFYKTFLPTKGWSVTAGAFTGTYSYYLCKKSFVQRNGLTMRWCFIHRFQWSGNIVQYVMPWTTSTADTTNNIHSESVANGFPGLSSERSGQHLQIWQSDVHTDAFFIKTREPYQTDGVHIATHFPDEWHFCDPAFGTEDTPDADVSVAPVWFTGTCKWSYQNVFDDWDAYVCYFDPPEYYTQRMYEEQYLTNKVVAKASNINVLSGTAEDILFRSPRFNSMGGLTWQAIGYQGKNYVDVQYVDNRGWMFDVGQVDPQTGV